jgi:hypothetical protein
MLVRGSPQRRLPGLVRSDARAGGHMDDAGTTDGCHGAPMTASFVLHLQSGALSEGDVCGVVEVVATGERYTVTTLDELGALLVKESLPRARTDEGGQG